MQGDVIDVISINESGWWDGVCDGRRGWFPSNYVESLEGNGSTKRSSVSHSQGSQFLSVSPSLHASSGTSLHSNAQSTINSNMAFNAQSYSNMTKSFTHKSPLMRNYGGLVGAFPKQNSLPESEHFSPLHVNSPSNPHNLQQQSYSYQQSYSQLSAQHLSPQTHFLSESDQTLKKRTPNLFIKTSGSLSPSSFYSVVPSSSHSAIQSTAHPINSALPATMHSAIPSAVSSNIPLTAMSNLKVEPSYSSSLHSSVTPTHLQSASSIPPQDTFDKVCY